MGTLPLLSRHLKWTSSGTSWEVWTKNESLRGNKGWCKSEVCAGITVDLVPHGYGTTKCKVSGIY